MDMWDATDVRARLGARALVLAPPLPEAEIRAFEGAHGIRLPAAYRAFVAAVGDGPAGPHHGLLPLTAPRPEADGEWAVDDEWEQDRLPGRLAAPFEPAGRGGQGTLTLAEVGCGAFSRLVLTGPRAGEVWCFDPDWHGFTPESPDFRTWYAAWLEKDGSTA
ncbi:SMI1/KNR4 family protein [Streptomyces sp. G-G2]|uniref:SMI1/KNR4 family protein n=1 Tax=Streptomyces sp. G-G2 TaxID=3046201 RepID=UPI0024BB49A7|nr:SMI1/KNR4 family protein [Streptomyces sp. G-G2]MDJ0379523.1 SMI1/KNR4 family protein [Streptomyces sp. G-G2]